jgi:TetR/AcrR family transcriptional regulator, transcriptional repressor for nem operon
MSNESPNSRTRLLAATVDLVRTKGYAATRVDAVCESAGVTKGSFFHHFATKDELAVAAADFWNQRATQLFSTAPYAPHPDPLDRLLGYVKFRRQLIAGEIWEYSCFAGTTIQEVHESHPDIRDACAASIRAHLQMLITMIEHALERYPVAKLVPRSLAIHMQAVLQGAFVMAKALQDKRAALDSIDHLHRYLEHLFAARSPHASRRQP